MWKILQSLQRAFRQHVHSPRPSAGLHVEDEQDMVVEKTEKLCPFSRIRKSSKESSEIPRCSWRALDCLQIESLDEELSDGRHDYNNIGRKEKRKWWRTYHRDFWQSMPHTNYMIEAISWGSAVLWGTDSDRWNRKVRLLYGVLSVVPGSSGGQRNVVDSLTAGSIAHKPSPLLAIKDAAGSAQDLAVNVSKTESLDSAIEEFQTMCNEYTARNEILLGLQAWEKGDKSTAVKHLRASCLLGNSSACFNLGLCYEKGSGVEPDMDKAERYYRLAAKGGDRSALFNLGLLYMNHLVEEDEVAAAHSGCKKREAISLMERAAKLGLAEAQTYLGMYHIDESKDITKAVQYFRAAADQHDAEAQYFLASCYEHGWGVSTNECRAAQLYSQAASAGHVTALYNLAEFNEHGLGGLPVDRSSALELYKKAADLGSEEAKYRLKEIEHEKKVAEQTGKVKELHINNLQDQGIVHTQSISPSISSPNLLDYLHGVPHYFSALWRAHPDSNANNSNVRNDFPLDALPDRGYHVPEPEFYTPREMHRSQTCPNMTLVACNM